MTSQFPDITSVDPSDATSMAALAHLLFSTYKLEGGFNNSIDPSMFRRLRESAEKWVFEIEKKH